jgi:alkanesulfonate monooxygenase SsuD/methylene tetrahydromethanopterin reductase-like flavin-dependent oxidoreductase (luciferase family)
MAADRLARFAATTEPAPLRLCSCPRAIGRDFWQPAVPAKERSYVPVHTRWSDPSPVLSEADDNVRTGYDTPIPAEEGVRRDVKIGLLVWTANERATNATRSYHSIRAITHQAEADGFDSIWLPDHFLYRYPGEVTRGLWETLTVLAALFEATQRLEIGTLVLCNSFRNPALLAKMATTADEVGSGRLILGVGAGWNEPEYDALGLPFDHRVDRFEEAMQILRPLLRDGHVDFAGNYYQAKDCDNVPRGPRPSGPPLMVGAEGPRMLRLAAQYADLWNTGYMGAPDTMTDKLTRISTACREVGRDPETLGVTALIGLWFSDLQEKQPGAFDKPLTGSAEQLAAAMRGYAQLGLQHIMFQVAPYTAEARKRLAEALQLYRES